MMPGQSGKSIEAGSAFVSFFADDSKLRSALAKVQGFLNGFGKVAIGAGAGLFAAGTAILAPLGLAVNSAVEFGSEMQDASDRTGIAVDQLSALKHAAEQSASGLEDLEKAIAFMQKNELGMGVEDFMRIADEVAASGNPMQTAMEKFGKAGKSLLPLLKGGSEGIRDLMDEAEKLGLVMSNEDAAAAEAFGDQLANVEKMAKMAVVQIGSALIPTLTELIEPVIQAGVGIGKFVKENREVAVIVAAVGVALIAGGAALMTLGTSAMMASAMISVAVSAVNAALFVFKLMNPELLIIIAAVGLATAVFAGLAAGLGILFAKSEFGAQILAELGEYFTGLWERAKEAFTGIWAAIKKGDWGMALKISWLALKGEFLRIVKEIHLIWAGFINTLTGLWSQFIQSAFGNTAFRTAMSVAAPGLPIIGLLNAAAGAAQMDIGKIGDEYTAQIKALDAERKRLIGEAVTAAPKKASAPKVPGSVWEKMGLADQGKGTFSSSAISQSLAISDKIMDRVAKASEGTEKNTKRAADALEDMDSPSFD